MYFISPFFSRPDTSFLWFLSPLKTLKYIFWKRFKWILLKGFIILLILVLLGLFAYTTPGVINQKIWGV